MKLAGSLGRTAAMAVTILLFTAAAAVADEAADKSPEVSAKPPEKTPAKPEEGKSGEKPKEVWISSFVSDTECHSELRPGSRISYTHCELKKKPEAAGQRDDARGQLEAFRQRQAIQEQIAPRTLPERVRQASSGF
jgi:hypothetical protein